MCSHRAIARLLFGLGCLDLLALTAVLMPHVLMRQLAGWLGVPELPAEPIVGYLARSASLMYALHGATLVFVSFDVHRYGPLIRLLAALAVAHGAALVVIDLAEDMPRWWCLFEGPAFAATGAAVLWLQGQARAAKSSE